MLIIVILFIFPFLNYCGLPALWLTLVPKKTTVKTSAFLNNLLRRNVRRAKRRCPSGHRPVLTRKTVTRRYWARSIGLKFPEIPVQNQMERKFSKSSFRKFWSTSGGCPFSRKSGNSRKFLYHLAFHFKFRPDTRP